MPDPEPRPVFHARVFDRLLGAIDAAAAEVPEVEAVAVVVLWRLDDQSSIPSVLVRDAHGGAPAAPDQLLRLHLAALRLVEYCVARSARGVAALLGLAADLATEARRDHARRTGPQATPRTEEPTAHGAAHDHLP